MPGITKSQAFGPAVEVKASDVKEHFDVNTVGPLLLFRATLPLLKRAALRTGKCISVSSPISSIGGMEQRPYPLTAYGISKAALNCFVRKIHFENQDFISFALDPASIFHFTLPLRRHFLGEPGVYNSGTALSRMTSATLELSISATRKPPTPSRSVSRVLLMSSTARPVRALQATFPSGKGASSYVDGH